MTEKAISPLRRRLIEDMAIRRLSPKTQYQYIRHVKKQAPQADCQVTSTNVSHNLILNRLSTMPICGGRWRSASTSSLYRYSPTAIALKTSGSTNSLCIPKMMPLTGAGCHGPQGMEADEGRSRGTEAGDRVGRKPFRLRAGLSQKPEGILRLPALDSPASMSIHEESRSQSWGR